MKGMNVLSIEKLREDIRHDFNFEIKVVSIEEGNNYGLDEASPAQLAYNYQSNLWTIVYLEILDEEESIEAESHELGHLLFLREGTKIVGLDTDKNELLYLIGQINNSLPHKYIIETLDETYNLTSNLHIKLLSNSLDFFPVRIEEKCGDRDHLNAIGVRLFDINRTVDNKEVIIEQIAALDEHVLRAFTYAKEILSQISPQTSIIEQKNLIRAFMDKLHYREGVDYDFYE
ncbi:hypothetical protein [Bacillus pseudomycoides]|uniref:hypothetical protein n=1 Tax=Bacillus pseudomycoides TaxID=64104 RepID=UPI003D648089